MHGLDLVLCVLVERGGVLHIKLSDESDCYTSDENAFDCLRQRHPRDLNVVTNAEKVARLDLER